MHWQQQQQHAERSWNGASWTTCRMHEAGARPTHDWRERLHIAMQNAHPKARACFLSNQVASVMCTSRCPAMWSMFMHGDALLTRFICRTDAYSPLCWVLCLRRDAWGKQVIGAGW